MPRNCMQIEASGSNNPVISISSGHEGAEVPQAGDIVLARVTRIQRDRATADIACVGQQKLPATFQGVVRAVDVRATEVDKVRQCAC